MCVLELLVMVVVVVVVFILLPAAPFACDVPLSRQTATRLPPHPNTDFLISVPCPLLSDSLFEVYFKAVAGVICTWAKRLPMIARSV